MRAELRAWVAHRHVDAAVKGGDIPPAHVPDPHLARHHPSGRPQAHLQQLEFDRREGHRLAAAAHYPRSVVQRKLAAPHRLGKLRRKLGGLRVRPAPDGAHPRREFAWVTGLGHIIVRAQFQTKDAVHIIPPRRQHQHGDGRLGADLPEDFETLHAREHDIQYDEGVLAGARACHALLAACDGLEVEPLGLQVLRQQFTKVDVVIDDQHARHRVFAPRSSAEETFLRYDPHGVQKTYPYYSPRTSCTRLRRVQDTPAFLTELHEHLTTR
jgi:hypothetical protein